MDQAEETLPCSEGSGSITRLTQWSRSGMGLMAVRAWSCKLMRTVTCFHATLQSACVKP